MYFKKLELVGFKSFCEKTTLHFEPGITAVVGPNGCGKSNIFDSIRWVLGEQSAKSLRGSEMLDVIFNGTDKRESVGLAEVSLTFDNESKFFNVDAPEVTITRRLFRSGESEYMLNKSTVRLKDILDILLGTGIGAESYSIIAQGKIDLVLSSKPDERRLVFDEASGITKYKAQKREATRKLEETEQNLLRVNDIVTEVKRQIGSLERQANKARKYKEVFDELSLKEIKLATHQKFELIRTKDGIINELKELESKELALIDEIRALELRIVNRQQELKTHEDAIMGLRNEIMSLENMAVRSNEHIEFNKNRLVELSQNKAQLDSQLEQTSAKLAVDEAKLKDLRFEFSTLRKQIDDKAAYLAEKEKLINSIADCIKGSLENIAIKKKGIIDIASKLANAKNAINDNSAKQQIFSARKKRLEIEKAKVFEEKKTAEETLQGIKREVESLQKVVEEFKDKLRAFKLEQESEGIKLANINSEILCLEKEGLTLQSHKDFLEKLKSKYEDINEAMNATIYLDKLPSEKLSGLVVKISEKVSLSDEDQAYLEPANFKLSGEAKPIELDTAGIDDKIKKITQAINGLRDNKMLHESKIENLDKEMISFEKELRDKEISLANKESAQLSANEQFDKVKEEEDLIIFELLDVDKEILTLEGNLTALNQNLSDLNKEQRLTEDAISQEDESISHNSKLREEVLVAITEAKTELSALNRRLVSDESTLKLWEDTFNQDSAVLKNLELQLQDNLTKKNALTDEIKEHEINIADFTDSLAKNKAALSEAEDKYRVVSEGSSEITRLEAGRKDADGIKNKLYELQMQNKDIDYRFAGIKERMLMAYKVDLDTIQEPVEQVDSGPLSQEIDELKKRLDSYGTVNLVAIEEYDELKKRYDFLIQQHTDLTNAKESLHQAILKINRTTKQMFIETFEKVKEEFRNYFRLLFNGGDAQLFLIDETDPLESGIEIICRPPGKKLQNVLLLSGGEKSMSAIALIFAIFKVKPSPFCILDEIDAALDEANVDRFSRILQEFAKTSQFIVITHNKRTIANADVMYGITMQESGISRIVSVKFAKGKEKQEEPEAAATSA
jgi:chromosome segregation protein